MKIGIVIGTKEQKQSGTQLRFGVTALKSNHETSLFLMNKCVEIEKIEDKKYGARADKIFYGKQWKDACLRHMP